MQCLFPENIKKEKRIKISLPFSYTFLFVFVILGRQKIKIKNKILGFGRRDSFITHRAFCDALAEESAKVQTTAGQPEAKPVVASPPPPPLTPSTTVVSPALSIQSSGSNKYGGLKIPHRPRLRRSKLEIELFQVYCLR